MHLPAMSRSSSNSSPWTWGLTPRRSPTARSDRDAVRGYLLKWHAVVKRTDTVRFAERVAEWYGSVSSPEYVEVFEMSRYGRQMSEAEMRWLFGMRGE